MHKTAQFFLKEYQGFAGGTAVSDEPSREETR